MREPWRAVRNGVLALLVTASACVSGGVDQGGSGGGGGGGGGSGAGELGTWRAGSVAMSGDEAYTYANVTLTFDDNPAVTTISATAGSTTYVWTGAYTRDGDVISTDSLPESSAGNDDLMTLDAQLSGSTLTGVLTESYPKGDRTFEVTGNFTATK